MNMYRKVLEDAAALRQQRKEKKQEQATYHDTVPAKWKMIDKARALIQELGKK